MRGWLVPHSMPATLRTGASGLGDQEEGKKAPLLPPWSLERLQGSDNGGHVAECGDALRRGREEGLGLKG